MNQNDEGQCGPTTQGCRGPSDEGYGKGSVSQCLLYLSSLVRSFLGCPKYLWLAAVSGRVRYCLWQKKIRLNQFCRLGTYKAMGPAGLHLVLLRG